MKHHQHITLVEANTTPTQVVQWAQALAHLHARIAARFARPEPRHRALKYLQGILSSSERKNGWQLAEHARERRPDGMQRLLSSAVWDTDGVRDDLRSYVLEQLGQESAILVIDAHQFSQAGPEIGWRWRAVLWNDGKAARIVRWASFSRMSQPEGIRSLIANSTCPWTGQRTVSAVRWLGSTSVGSLPDETGTGQTHVSASMGCPGTDCLGGSRHGLWRQPGSAKLAGSPSVPVCIGCPVQ